MEKSRSPLFRFFFLNQVFSIVLVMSLIATGFIGYQSMIKESIPDLEIPQALISTVWPGASPEVVEKEITEKIEQQIKGMKGLRRYRSGSMESMSLIAVEFRAEASIPESMLLLRRKVNNAEAYLPKGAEKPNIEQVSIRDIPIATFAIFGDMDDAVLGETAKRIQKRLKRIPGVKKVMLYGNREEIIRIQLIPERIRALGIPPTLIRARIMEHDKDVPWGTFQNRDLPFTVKMAGAFRDVESMLNLPIIRIPEGRVIRLGEVARVSRALDRELTRTLISWRGSEWFKGIGLSLFKSPGQDTVRLIDLAKKEMEKVRQSPDWVHGTEYRLVFDEAVLIREELNKAFRNGWQAMLIVFIILFFLLTWREAIVAALSIPLTFVGAMAVLWAMGYTFNVLVIIGMVLALGLLVDDFILIMEGMHEGIFMQGLGFVQAAGRTLKAYAIPSLSGSLTTILVFAPLAAIGGIDGKFIRLIPVTAAVCLVLSYMISILIDISLSRPLLDRKPDKTSKNLVDGVTEKLGGHLRQWLRSNAVCSKSRAFALLLIALSLFGISIVAAGTLPSILYPKEDGRELGITIELPSESTLDESAAVGEVVGELLRSKPYFTSVVMIVGEKDPFLVGSISEMLTESTAPYYIGFLCLFTPKRDRDKLAFEFVEDLRTEIEKTLRTVPGAVLIITPDIGGATAEDPVQIDITGEDMDKLREISQKVQAALRIIPGAVDIRDTLGQTRAHASLKPRREVMDFYNIAEPDMAAQMRIYMENDKVGKFRTPGTEEDLEVHLSTFWRSRNGQLGGPTEWDELQRLTIINDRGERVPLSALVVRSIDQTPLAITHKEGVRCATVKAKTNNTTVNEILAHLQPKLVQWKQTWPVGYAFDFAGEKEAAEETYASVHKVFVLSVFIVFAILSVLFNSLKQPVIILFSVVFGLMGVFGGFFLLGLPISFPAMIGIVSLIGINVNDAIIMIDTMNRHRARGLSVKDAAARGAADRLRPIVSTTVTTTMGLIPLALSDPGWMPLCAAIISGELASTGTSLVLIPCLFLLLTPEKRTGELTIETSPQFDTPFKDREI